jgi:hypothetical protein
VRDRANHHHEHDNAGTYYDDNDQYDHVDHDHIRL